MAHRWCRTGDQHRQTYGYRPETIEHCQQVSLTPQLGDALLFNPANFHAVEPNPDGRRIAFAFFLGLVEGELGDNVLVEDAGASGELAVDVVVVDTSTSKAPD